MVRKRKTATKPKVKKVRKTKPKSKKIVKTKVKKTTTKKPRLNLTPTEKRLLGECKEILRQNPKLRSKGLNKIKDLEKRKYYYLVWAETEKQPLNTLKYYTKRCFRGPRCYHLDHIYPISRCYLDGIPPEKCGHITNLRFIKAKDNVDKGHTMTEESHKALRRIKRLK